MRTLYADEVGVIRPSLRDAHASVLRRARWLDDVDRRVIELALKQQATNRQIAGVMGIAPGTVSRRIWRITNRLHDPLIVRLIDRPRGLRPRDRQLGIEYFLLKRPIHQLAASYQLSRTEVRAILAFLRLWSRL